MTRVTVWANFILGPVHKARCQTALEFYNNVNVCFSAVLHGHNLLVFGGTGIPFGENNGNDVHVCNVQYRRWNLLNCRGKKPNKIYGQVTFVSEDLKCCSVSLHFPLANINQRSPFPGDGHHKWLPLCVWRDNWLLLQHRPAQVGPDHQRVGTP